ncbi:MAG: ArnT family glycosyltransferase [Enterobacteriaceae bacterium]
MRVLGCMTLRYINMTMGTLRQRNFYLLLALLCCYAIVGVVGHSPWKQDEAYSFGIIHHMFISGEWLIPTNAGQPFMEKPPLFYWTATIFAHLFGRWLPLYDAARMASLFYSLINFLFLFLLAQRCFKSPRLADWRAMLAVMIAASTPGLLKHSHDLFTDVALYTGATIALYGLQGMVNVQGRWSGNLLWFSLGLVMTFLAKGIFIPGLLGICNLLLPLLLPSCRNRSWLLQIIVAAAVALPFILAWPVAVYRFSVPIFNDWFWQNNIGRFVGFSVPTLGAAANSTRIIGAFLLFAFPAGILSLLALTGRIRQFKRGCPASVALCLLFAFTGVLALQLSSSSRQLYLLPFIAPLSILAVYGVFMLSEKWLRVWQHASTLLFSGLSMGVWLIWLMSLSPRTMPWLSWLSNWLPMDFHMPLQPLALVPALLLSAIWLLRHRWLHHRPAIAVVQQWFIGMTLLWGLVFSLLLPWIECAKGYRDVFASMQSALAGQFQAGDCMASYDLGESEAPLLYYYTGILHHPLESPQQDTSCRWLLIEYRGPVVAPEGMQQIWQGHRDGEKKERFALFLRRPG